MSTKLGLVFLVSILLVAVLAVYEFTDPGPAAGSIMDVSSLDKPIEPTLSSNREASDELGSSNSKPSAARQSIESGLPTPELGVGTVLFRTVDALNGNPLHASARFLSDTRFATSTTDGMVTSARRSAGPSAVPGSVGAQRPDRPPGCEPPAVRA